MEFGVINKDGDAKDFESCIEVGDRGDVARRKTDGVVDQGD